VRRGGTAAWWRSGGRWVRWDDQFGKKMLVSPTGMARSVLGVAGVPARPPCAGFSPGAPDEKNTPRRIKINLGGAAGRDFRLQRPQNRIWGAFTGGRGRVKMLLLALDEVCPVVKRSTITNLQPCYFSYLAVSIRCHHQLDVVFNFSMKFLSQVLQRVHVPPPLKLCTPISH
jgi:hypothetical protein